MQTPVITVVAITAIQHEATRHAIAKTCRELPVAHKSVLLTPHLQSLRDYSQFVLSLGKHIDTPFALVVQYDGYALDGTNWSDEFLNYDYIGAPWPPWFGRHWCSTVGNGGFSLRSKRWLEACAEAAPHWKGEPEDAFMCRTMQGMGCKIAPVDVALRFSQEHRIPERPWWRDRDSFGFHGRFGWAGFKLPQWLMPVRNYSISC